MAGTQYGGIFRSIQESIVRQLKADEFFSMPPEFEVLAADERRMIYEWQQSNAKSKACLIVTFDGALVTRGESKQIQWEPRYLLQAFENPDYHRTNSFRTCETIIEAACNVCQQFKPTNKAGERLSNGALFIDGGITREVIEKNVVLRATFKCFALPCNNLGPNRPPTP